MSQRKNKAPASSAKPTADSYAHRPVTLFWMVLIATGLSTWCWYRPLPKRAIEVATGAVSTDPYALEQPPHSRWQGASLVVPSLRKTEAEGSVTFNGGSQDANGRGGVNPPQLTGSSDMALSPYIDRDRPLKDWLAGEPLPMVPVETSMRSEPRELPQPTLWTSAPGLARDIRDRFDPTREINANSSVAEVQSTFGGASDAASPFRVPNVSRTSAPDLLAPTSPSLITNLWPDQGFDPSRLAAPEVQSRNAAMHPSLSDPKRLEPMQRHDAVMASSSNRIRTLDSEGESRPSGPSLPTQAIDATKQKVLSDSVGSNRIRQPRSGDR